MNPYLVRGVMSDYAAIAVDNGPYVVLIHTAVGHVNRVSFFIIRKNNRYGLLELQHHLKQK